MKHLTTSFLFCLSSAVFAEAEKAPEKNAQLEALDLEKIVIRGEAKPNPAALERLRPRKLALPRTRIETSPLPLVEKARWQNTLKVLGGNHSSWSASNSLSIKRKDSAYGLLADFEGAKGFREGHGKTQNAFEVEWSRTRANNPSYYFSSSIIDRDMDLPEPESLFFRGHTREEQSIRNNFRFESPLFKEDNFQLHIDNVLASQDDTQRSSYRSSLWRIGFLYNVGQWKTALSVENDKRDVARTTISRFFVQKSSHILDKNTNLHLGLGFYSFSNKSETLRNSGFLSLIEQDQFKNGVALSPFAQLDHNVTDQLSFFIAYSQVYESKPFVETYFDNPILSQPSDFIQPSLNIQIESGVRFQFLENWKTSLSYSLNKYRNRLVFIEDFTVINNKITTDLFDKGRESQIRAEIEGLFFKRFSIQLSHQYLFSDWQNPNIDFTPFQSRQQSHLGIDYQFNNLQLGIETDFYNRSISYPSRTTLPSGHSVNFKSQWRLSQQFKLYMNIYNLTQRHNLYLLDYPKPPMQFMSGLGFRF